MKASIVAALALCLAGPALAQESEPFYQPRAVDLEGLNMLGDEVYELRICPTANAARMVVEEAGVHGSNGQGNEQSYNRALRDLNCRGVAAGPLRLMAAYTYSWTVFSNEAPMLYSVRARDADGVVYNGVVQIVF